MRAEEEVQMRRTIGIATTLSIAVAAGCSQLPEQIETLDQARTAVEAIEQDPLARDVAQTRYEQARAALGRAEEAYEEDEDLEIIEHEAYTALRNAQIVQAEADERRARDELEDSEADRNRVLLQAREREAEQAQRIAAERGQALTEREQQLELQARQTAEAERRARELAQEAQSLEQQRQELQQQLVALEAEQTERGWVMTLGDVLFRFDEAELAPGATVTMDRLAEFMEENPERIIAIEGHTDSSGAASYNRDLSRQRAEAVRQALVDRGIPSRRIEIRALGEEFPVATNDTDTGRQLNRRVEIVLSGQEGQFEGEQRSASAEPTEQEG
jgi:outer membrane protein OmpA-like peptidoglycan-associated protein